MRNFQVLYFLFLFADLSLPGPIPGDGSRKRKIDNPCIEQEPSSSSSIQQSPRTEILHDKSCYFSQDHGMNPLEKISRPIVYDYTKITCSDDKSS